MDFGFIQAGSLLGLVSSVGLALATYLANKYVIPFLAVGRRQRYAEHIATIADELTDELRTKYPERSWLEHLDEVIDRLIDICNIRPEIARRALRAAAARK